MEKMDWKKLGLWALAGFGAFALYERYGKSTPEVVVLEDDEEPVSFTGTRWQNAGRSRETGWQTRGVFNNASGDAMDLTPAEARSVSNLSFTTRPFGGKRGRYAGANGYSNLSGTAYQRSGYGGTRWQDANMNACGACS